MAWAARGARLVLSLCHVAHSQRHDFIMLRHLALYLCLVSGQHGRCCTVATYPQDVQVLNAQPDRMSYRPMMALTSDA
jgi:hypothetical protein